MTVVTNSPPHFQLTNEWLEQALHRNNHILSIPANFVTVISRCDLVSLFRFAGVNGSTKSIWFLIGRVEAEKKMEPRVPAVDIVHMREFLKVI